MAAIHTDFKQRAIPTSQLILVAIKGQHTQVVFGPALPGIVGAKKSELTKSGNWAGWRFEIRSIKGYLNKKILTKTK